MNTEKTPKKVLLVTRPIAPPWDEASKNFAYYLAKNVKSVDFYLLTNGFIQGLPANVHQKPIYTSNALSYLQKVRMLKLIRMKKEFDIMHFMLTPNKLNSFSFKTFIRNKRARTIQTVATLREDLFSAQDFKDILFADLIITYSDYAKNKLNALGFKNVKRVYPGIDLEIFSPAPKDQEIKEFLQVTDEDFIIQYPGEYVRLGATDDIVNLLLKYAKEFQARKIKICFPGRMKGPEDYAKMAEVQQKLEPVKDLDIVRYAINSSLASLKGADFMSRRLNTADLILFPVQNMQGKFDIPLVVPEAMACEKPVILSDLPILKELTNGQNSVIIPRGDIDALYAAIIDLYDHPEKRAAIGKNARAFVQENFDIKKVAEIYQEIYEKL